MSQPPFLNSPADDTAWRGQVPDALFDLAMNRAAAQVRRLPVSQQAAALARWHARTRFARRIPLAAIVSRLHSRPPGQFHWHGGPNGDWQPGLPAFP